jgi:hypothetical protein
MLIANPIYDVVFKYMMEDARVARLFLSVIMQREIIDIRFLPQELSGVKATDSSSTSLNLSIYRLDFAATVFDDQKKEALIIIEVQKTRLYGDIMRFRRYLGKQYMGESHHYISKDSVGTEYQVGIPIYSIYFLGTSLKGLEVHPIIRLQLKAISQSTGEELPKDNDFIKGLYHEGTIINIPALKSRHRNELELLLTIFDQTNRTEDMHIMNVKEQDFPEKFQPIIRRLKQAVEVKEVRDVMEIEDDFVKELNEYEERIARQTALFENERHQKEEAQRQKEEAQRQKEEAQRQKEEAILLLLRNGFSAQMISEQLNIPIDVIESLR